MIIRILGLFIGVGLILIFGIMLYEGGNGYMSPISGMLLGTMFVIYGIGGPRTISRIAPSLVKETSNLNIKDNSK